MTATTVRKNCAMLISKADCIAWDYNYIVFKALGCFWSFLKLYSNRTFMCTITLKGEISNWDAIAYCKTEQFRSKGQIASEVSSKKNTLTVDTDDCTFNCNNADGHSQTGNRKKLASRIQKTSWRTKATRSALRLCLHTVAY